VRGGRWWHWSSLALSEGDAGSRGEEFGEEWAAAFIDAKR
jgi:hypothetical protein